MARIVVLPVSRTQRLLARCQEEERAFRLVLGSLRAGRRDKLFLELFGFYRVRMRILRRLAGALASEWEASSAGDDLQALRTREDGVHAAIRGDDEPAR